MRLRDNQNGLGELRRGLLTDLADKLLEDEDAYWRENLEWHDRIMVLSYAANLIRDAIPDGDVHSVNDAVEHLRHTLRVPTEEQLPSAFYLNVVPLLGRVLLGYKNND